MPRPPRPTRRAGVPLLCASLPLLWLAPHARAGITITQGSSTSWTINNGNLNVLFNPARGYITSLKVGASSTNILNPAKSLLYPEFAGTPFGSGAVTSGYSLAPDGSYVDFWTSTASAGNATYSNGTLVNPLTYAFHYIMYNNDPDISCYEVLNHAASDPATSVGQGQFLLRVNPTLMTNTYQVNVGINNPGVQTSTFPDYATYTADMGVTGRKVQDATTDLTGSLPGDWGTHFATKYDFSSYEQFHQAQLEYGPTYALSTILPSHDSMTGGPTKQNLQFTDTILMQEFLSGHYGDSHYSYTPPQGVDSSRLFGPYVFRITTTGNKAPSQLYQDALNSIPTFNARYDSESTLIANGYIPSSQRGAFQVTAANPAGWTANTNAQTVVLSDPHTNFQESHQGYQYWAQFNQNGTASISGIVPGTYRMSIYQLGQWGETRVDGVAVAGGTLTIPTNVTFTPENFSTNAPIWTIGTPNRSANEFLNGHNAAGADIRAYQGSYDYWAEEQALGTPGKIVYYATSVGSHPATNNPARWLATQWGKFNPGLYDPANNTSDNYANIAPNYVQAAGGPGSYTGSPWEVHFATTQDQLNQGQYAILSVGLAAAEASLVVTLNGHQEIWHSSNHSDPMVRSGDAGYYQWLAFQFPTSDLLSPGSDNLLTFGVSASWGVMYDALRLEITNRSASPSVTGWHDYEYITGPNAQIPADNTLALSETQLQNNPLPGDANLDGVVDAADLQVVLNHFGQATSSWLDGNFTSDPVVNLSDLSNVFDNFGAHSSLAGSASGTSTPEPASLACLLFPAMLLLKRRR